MSPDTVDVVITITLEPQPDHGMSALEWDRLERWIVDHFYARFKLRVASVNVQVAP